MALQVEVPAGVAVAREIHEVMKTVQVPAVDRSLVEQLVAGARGQGLSIDGENGLLAQLTKFVVESALEGEITDHLGYEKNERPTETTGNARNGKRAKTVLTKAGPIEIEVPRDRAGTFTPAIVKKRQRRLTTIEASHLPAQSRRSACTRCLL